MHPIFYFAIIKQSKYFYKKKGGTATTGKDNNMARVQSEYNVETNLIERLKEIGYEFIPMKNLDDVKQNFRDCFCKVNKKTLEEAKGTAELSDSEFERLMTRVNNHPVYESARILREQWILPLDNGKSVYVDLLTDDLDRNTYQVTHQVTMDKEHAEDVRYKNRYDVTILINGLPLIQIELKRPGVELNEAVNQINRYRNHSFRELFRYIQIFVVSNSNQTKYFANANETYEDGTRRDLLKSLTFYWTDENNRRITELIPFTEDFLRKSFITEVLNKYYIVKQSEPTLMVMRPYQIYAVKKAYDRIIMSHMNGYVFHTTGSGKTLTSFKLATLLRDNHMINKVFFLIDRKDLDDQTVDEYNSFEAGCVDNTDNTKQLVADIEDSSKTMIITTIQKMSTAIRSPKYAKTMKDIADKRVVFIIDECHRSQFGKMHAQIEHLFTNANYIGFTGTPIFPENKTQSGYTTADVFRPYPNYDPKKDKKMDSCIHKYMIKEAIADGNVLRFSVEYWRSLHIQQIHGDGSKEVIDVKKLDDSDYCRRHNIDMEAIYHSDDRIAQVSEDILGNLEKHTHPQGKDVYTALFAVDSIPTLVKYYDYMKAHNPKGYKIAAIFSYQPNSDDSVTVDAPQQLERIMADYNEMFRKPDGTKTSYDLQSFDAYRKDIQKRMKQKNMPQIDLLLVVNMFLTGFDSKPTNTLFLDKDLKWQTLVQAYSRTNRVDKPTKMFGQIITYRNIKKAQDDALKLYSGSGDPDAFLMKTYEYYLTEYRKDVEAVRGIVPKAGECAYLDDENKKKAFVLCFRKLAGTFATLQTFSKFDWNDLAVFMDEDEYYAYKGWYLTFYDEMKGGGNGGGDSVLCDVDFDIEYIRTDRINVVYILRLLKQKKKEATTKEQMADAVDLIMREIERSDNDKLRHQKDIMKAFIETRFFDLPDDADLEQAYADYVAEKMQASVEDFARKNSLPEDLVSDIVNQYFCDSASVTREYLRQKFQPLGLGLLKLTQLIKDTILFVKEMYDVFTTEDE